MGDEMAGMSSTAFVYSLNVENFSYPYNGGTRAGLLIRSTIKSHKKGRGRYEFYVNINRGQIKSSADMSNNILLIKFDEKKSGDMFFEGRGDNNEAIILMPGGTALGPIASGRGFLRSLAESKIFYIRLPIYNEGNIIFKFDVSGLDLSKL